MKKNTFVCLAVAVLVVLALSAIPINGAQAQEDTPPLAQDTGDVVTAPPDDQLLPTWDGLEDFLAWLVGPGLTISVAWFMSHVVDKFKSWQKVPHDLKVILPFVVAVAVVYLGDTLLTQFPTLVNDKTLNLIFQSLIFYWTTQKQHVKFEQAAASQ